MLRHNLTTYGTDIGYFHSLLVDKSTKATEVYKHVILKS